MSITAVSAAYLTQGPSASGQILAPNELSNLENAFVGTATATLDGTATSFVLNFIDGTKTLSFTPTAIEAQVVGGTQVTTATPIGVLATSVTDNTKGTVYLSAAGTAAKTLTILFSIVK